MHLKVKNIQYRKISTGSDVFLFLDDLREPKEAFNHTGQEMFLQEDWTVVRNFEEFKNYLETHGLPKFISFDHDLAYSHYTPEHLWDDYEKSKAWQEEQVHEEKTGFECAVWLFEHCMEKGLKLPSYYCHSMNPVGKDKILGLLDSFESVRDKMANNK